MIKYRVGQYVCSVGFDMLQLNRIATLSLLFSIRHLHLLFSKQQMKESGGDVDGYIRGRCVK